MLMPGEAQEIGVARFEARQADEVLLQEGCGSGTETAHHQHCSLFVRLFGWVVHVWFNR